MNLIIRANGIYLRPRNGNLYQQHFQALREIMEKGEDAQRYFTTVEPNDVLLGRGAPIINNEGNVRFRKIVAERKDEYQASRRHQFKNKIAAEIIEVVYQRKGRFLRMADDTDKLKASGCIPKDAKSVWVIADDSAILQKVKQALRELDVAAMSTTMPDQNRKRTDVPHIEPNRSTTSKRSRNYNQEDPFNADGYSLDLHESRDITSSTEKSSKNLKKSTKPGTQLSISHNHPDGLLEVTNKPLPVAHESVNIQEIKNHLEPRQQENSAKPLRVANQEVFSTATSEGFIGNSIGTRQPTHNYHAVVPIHPNQANEMMDSMYPQRLDDTSVFSMDELLLQQQLLLQDQEEYHRNMLVFQHHRQQQERQLQLMQLNRNQYQQQMEWHSNTPTNFNAEILATDLPVHDQIQPSQAYDDSMRNSSEMFKPPEINRLRQNQLHLQQQQYVSGLLPAEYHPNPYSMSESHQRNNLIVMQQDTMQRERESMGVNLSGAYSDRSLEQPLLQENSSLDRLIALSIQTGMNDSFRNQAYSQIFHTDNENDKVDDDQIGTFKNFFNQDGAR